MSSRLPISFQAPLAGAETIQLAHGGGGRLMRSLIEDVFFAAFDSQQLQDHHDGARLETGGQPLAFTTDSYVVHPLVFPGGDIGSLAVNGTVNDLAMCGASPIALSAGFILEEGLPIETLRRVVTNMAAAARSAGVAIVTGDTKVVDRGKGDGIYINTSGVGVIESGAQISPRRVRAGDAVLLSGDVGRHGIAVLAVREGMTFESKIVSDCAPLTRSVRALFQSRVDVHCLRDLTRGGLASAINEVSLDAGLEVVIHEEAIPVIDAVRGACELLGLDPLYVANEGRFLAIVPANQADTALEALMTTAAEGVQPTLIGQFAEASPHPCVRLKNRIGTERLLDLLSGEQLPRIC